MELEAARHLCQEARVVLTSLRGGPPIVARGELAHDLVDIRKLAIHTLNSSPLWLPRDGSATTETASVTTGSTAPLSPLKFEPPTNLDPPAPLDVGPFARPFLAVVMDPRAAGPHTLVALRSLHRLLERKSLQVISTDNGSVSSPRNLFTVELEPLTKGILNCKFEQTDAGSDEAVEMAIADLIALVVKLDRRALRTETLMDAFNTVFITRNTFVHSPALCYHFEDVLTSMCTTVFSDLDGLRDPAGKMILEFLVNQLLHTPFVGGDDDSSREAQMAHDATRVLCLRLTRTALKTGFDETEWSNEDMTDATTTLVNKGSPDSNADGESRSLLQIVQDDLCLALLMTGQAVWAYKENNHIAPGFISLEVLSEICSTLNSLWTSISLRRHLVPQFEAIFTGFYQRAIVLLRKCPNSSVAFHSNLYFDAVVEIILESLVDILTLHDHRHTVAEGKGGSLETLFAFYDCDIKRSDVAVGLMVELCRCTGSKVDEEGLDIESTHDGIPSSAPTPTSPPTPAPASGSSVAVSVANTETIGFRAVPSHLRELCAQAIIGGMKCLFQDDHASDETKAERLSRQSILAGHVSPAPQSWSDLNRVTSSHHLRNIKSKKRLMRRAAQLFNEKSNKGIEFLVGSGVIESPVTPRAVASFLRNAIVVGLDKRAVGMYLGEVGKSPESGSNTPEWQLDWFHKEALHIYCSLFRFERQSLLDGLRMFLAAFRLPGEAQQIDRILEAFSESCTRVCDEGINGSLKIFSEDPKKASDTAYLLSFSIIMLNTDLHNGNIREDRKMSKADFVKYNTSYKEITEKGKELPRDYLEAIYESIRLEEIRTEGEGADGSMTVERWKDVLRGSAGEVHNEDLPSVHDAEDLTELVLEHLWMPIMSSVSALWGVGTAFGQNGHSGTAMPEESVASLSLGPQGARLGMDMAWDMLVGVRQLGRNDIFCKIFNCVCTYTGLLSYASDPEQRWQRFAHSVEAQSALVVAIRIAREATDEIGVDGWKNIWLMLFELRDLKMLGGGKASRGRSILMESEQDLLTDTARREWTAKLLNRGFEPYVQAKKKGVTSMFGAMGRALFGSSEDVSLAEQRPIVEVIQSVHGKEKLIVWDEIASSDDEDENEVSPSEAEGAYSVYGDSNLTLGVQFERILIEEELLLNRQREMPVTGLERVEDPNGSRVSTRARVRRRLSKCCEFGGLVSESRFLDNVGIGNHLDALISLIKNRDRLDHNGSLDTTSPDIQPPFKYSISPLSPASESFTEIIIAEIALRNRDRLTTLWHNHLKAHYRMCLNNLVRTFTENDRTQFQLITGSVEKCVTGLLRVAGCAVQRGDICNDVLESFMVLSEAVDDKEKKSLVYSFDRHISEGMWRIVRSIDESSQLQDSGWNGILALLTWCVNRGYTLTPVRSEGGLPEDDPSYQAFRSLHFLINVSEVKHAVPPKVVKCIRTLVATGEVRNCPKLSIAGLDLLHALSTVVESAAIHFYRESSDDGKKSAYWDANWMPILESMAEACHASSVSGVRQHALSMLADSFLENEGGLIPVDKVSQALAKLCIPMAGHRIMELRESASKLDSSDGVSAELELCVSLIFKPLRHHIQNLLNGGIDALLPLWIQILNVLQQILDEPSSETHTSENEQVEVSRIVKSSNELTLEHLRNIIMVLISYDALKAEPEKSNDISAVTWSAVANIACCSSFLDEWKQAAAKQ